MRAYMGAMDALKEQVPRRERPTKPLFARGLAGRSRSVMGVFAGLVTIAMAVVAIRMQHTSQPSAHDVYATQAAEYRTVSLANGTQATIGPMTRMVATTTASGLDVVVNGQVFFRVTPHTSSPVVVRTRNAIVQVLGTRFGVRQYSDELASHVLVDAGRISVRSTARSAANAAAHDHVGRSASETPVILSARMVAQVSDSGIVTDTERTAQDFSSLEHGELTYDGTVLHDVVADLGRAYGVDIQVPDSTLAQKPMWISIDVRQGSLTNILNLIGLATGAHAEHRGNVYHILPGRSGASRPATHSHPRMENAYGR